MRLVLPKLYVILDHDLLNIPARDCASQLLDAGVRLLQYRNKTASARQVLDTSRELASLILSQGASLIVKIGRAHV